MILSRRKDLITMIDDENKYKYCNNDPEILSDLVVAIYEQAIHDYLWGIKTLSHLLHKKKCNLTKDNIYTIIKAERFMHEVDILLKNPLYDISQSACDTIYNKLHRCLKGRLMVSDYVYGRGEVWKDYQERLSGKRPRKVEKRSTL